MSSATYSFAPGTFFAAASFFSSSTGFFFSIVAGFVAFGSAFAPKLAPIPAFFASAALIYELTPPAAILSLIDYAIGSSRSSLSSLVRGPFLTTGKFLSDSFFVVGTFLGISFSATVVLVSLPVLVVLGVLGSPSSAPFLVATIFLMPGVIRPVTFPTSLLHTVAFPVTYEVMPPAAILSFNEASIGSSVSSLAVFLLPAFVDY